MIYSFENFLLAPYWVHSVCNCYRSIWETYSVQSPGKKLHNSDVEGLEETEKRSNLTKGGGKEKAEKVRIPLPLRVVSEIWLLGNVDGQVAGILAHIMPYAFLIISWMSYLCNCIVL